MPTNKQRNALVLVLLTLILGVGLWCYYHRPKPVIYAGFGIEIPGKYPIVGVDVSRYQGRLFWEELSAMVDQNRGVTFVFIKSTEGLDYIDPRFERNWQKAADEGLSRGAYHYFHPSQNAQLQAIHFLKNTPIVSKDMRPVLDVEVLEGLSPDVLRDRICDWLTIVGNAYHTAPIIYSNAHFYNQYLAGFFDDYPLWIAQYEARKPAVKTDFQFWQFSDRVNGCAVPIDFNVFNGDSQAFAQLKIHAAREALKTTN